MSLAQRRTAPEGINIITEEGFFDNNGYSSSYGHHNPEAAAGTEQRPRRGSTATQTTLLPPAPEGEVLWQTISYDAFAHHEPQQYEPVVFPPEDVDHLAAYEVSGPKRIGE